MPKQITLEEILSKLEVEIKPVADIDLRDGKWLIEQDEVEDFITTYFTQFAEGLLLEAKDLASEYPRGEEIRLLNKVNSKINKALGKE